MNVEMTVDANSVAKTFRVLRKIDPDSVKVLRKELRTELAPTARRIAAEYPKTPLLSGFEMAYNKWRWDNVVGKVAVTPGKSRTGAGRNNLVSLSMEYKAATPFVIDMLGQKTQGRTPQGEHLYKVLQERLPAWPNGGRVFYRSFVGSAHTISQAAKNIINNWTDQVNEELS